MLQSLGIGIFGLLAIIGVVLLVAGIGIYNGLIGKRVEKDNAWSQIDVQLKRRYDLIPNLVETVKGYASHEKETLERVIQARNMAMGRRLSASRRRRRTCCRARSKHSSRSPKLTLI